MRDRSRDGLTTSKVISTNNEIENRRSEKSLEKSQLLECCTDDDDFH
jgi:hypothetical protein